MRIHLLAVLVMASCPKPGPIMPDVASTRAIAPPPGVVTYTRVNVAGPFDLPDVQIREQWEGPALNGERVLYDVITDNAATGHQLEVVRVFYGPEGYGYVGTIQPDGTLQRWDPAQIVLPPNAKIGDSWEGTHQKGPSLSVRSCEILASEGCEGGMVTVCESKRDGGRIVLRDHFCPGAGWSGFEALVMVPSQPTVRMWSEGVQRDGTFLTPLVREEVAEPEVNPIDPEMPPPPVAPENTESP